MGERVVPYVGWERGSAEGAGRSGSFSGLVGRGREREGRMEVEGMDAELAVWSSICHAAGVVRAVLCCASLLMAATGSCSEVKVRNQAMVSKVNKSNLIPMFALASFQPACAWRE